MIVFLEEELKKYQIIIIKTKYSNFNFKRYEIFLNFLENKDYKNIFMLRFSGMFALSI